MKIAIARLTAVATLIIGGLLASPRVASANSCSTELSKFVEDWSGGAPVGASVGEKANLFVYDRPIDTCGVVVNTAYNNLGATGNTDWFEAGTKQWGPYAGFPAGTFNLFMEYRDYPASTVVTDWKVVLPVNNDAWIIARNVYGTYQWFFRYSSDGVNWTTIGTSSALNYDSAIPESELSRKGDGSSVADVRSLQYDGLADHSWHDWTGIHCDVNTMNDYDVQVYSSTEWANVHTPVVGNC